MLGISKVAMGSAMVVAVSLFLVFVLLLLLYVELCCSLLWQRRFGRRLQSPLPTTAPSDSGIVSSTKPQNKSHGEDVDGQKAEEAPGSPLRKPVSPSAAAYYAHGVLQTPASFFFATAAHADAPALLLKQGEVKEMLPLPSGKTSLHFLGLILSPRSATRGEATCDSIGSRCSPEEHFVCISNPIYDGTCSSTGALDGDDGGSTPFETPDTSPSRLEMDDDDHEEEEVLDSPALKPMKKLPAVLPMGTPAASLADGRQSLGTSISATDTNRPSSSSSSNSTSTTSPSW